MKENSPSESEQRKRKNDFILVSAEHAVAAVKDPKLALFSIVLGWFTVQSVLPQAKPGQEAVLPVIFGIALAFTLNRLLFPEFKIGHYLKGVPGHRIIGLFIVIPVGLSFIVIFAFTAFANLIFLAQTILRAAGIPEGYWKLYVPILAVVLGYVGIEVNARLSNVFGKLGYQTADKESKQSTDKVNPNRPEKYTEP